MSSSDEPTTGRRRIVGSSSRGSGGRPPENDTEPYGWDSFTERPAPEEDDFESPAKELRVLLQRYRSELGAERGRARDAAADALAVAVDQGVLVAHFASALARHEEALRAAGLGLAHKELRILKDQMVEALRGGGVTLQDPAGLSLAEVADRVEVIGWRHAAEFAAPVVAETHEVVVLHRGAVVRPGQVTMGGPLPPEAPDERTPEPEADEEQPS